MNPILCEFLDIQSELKTQTLYKKQQKNTSFCNFWKGDL